MMDYYREALDDAKSLMRTAWALARRRPWWFIAFAGVAAAAILLIWPYDTTYAMWLAEDRPEPFRQASKFFRWWGSFIDTLFITAACYGLGVIFRKRRVRRAAIACFIAACLTGLSVNVVRFTTGRPRPKANMVDGFYGPTFDHKRQSFPSGHAGTSSGGALALAVALPAAGAPVLVSAAGVVWSCLYSKNHYPTDVLASLALAALYGIPLGWAARRQPGGPS